MNRFVLIIPYRNAGHFLHDCYHSILAQKYTNWIAIFCDDASTDGTSRVIERSDKVVVRTNVTRITALPNIHFGIMSANLKQDDIVCLIDGDDFLMRDDALNIIDNLYQDNTMVTYGQYTCTTGQPGHCRPYTLHEFQNLRQTVYLCSHLRTFRYALYIELVKQDSNLGCYKDSKGNYYDFAYDVAMMFPLMEIAGYHNIKYNKVPLYGYRIHSQNDHSVNRARQAWVEMEIRKKPNFRRVF